VRVAGQRELRLQPGFVKLFLLLEVEGVGGQEAGRGQAHERRGRGKQHHVDVALPDAPQRGQPLGDQVLVRRERVVRQRLPVGEDGDAQARREEREFAFEPLRVGGLCGDDGGELLLRRTLLRVAREQQRVGRAERSRQRVAFAGGDGGDLHPWGVGTKQIAPGGASHGAMQAHDYRIRRLRHPP
jgi:hypothetical protein